MDFGHHRLGFPVLADLSCVGTNFRETQRSEAIGSQANFRCYDWSGSRLGLVASPASLPLVVLLNLMTVAWFVIVIYVGL